MIVAFTYLVKLNSTGQMYYGVRYAEGCSPDDMWTTYFTSSTYVRDLIKLHGKEAFSYEIRRTFESIDKAIIWERNVLKRMRVYERADFINKNAGGLIKYEKRIWVNDGHVSKFVENCDLGKFICNGFTKGRIFSEDQKKKISDGVKRFVFNNPDIHKGKGLGRKLSAETKRKIGAKTTARKGIVKFSEKTKKKMRDKRKGSDNANAKLITINGTQYPWIKDAMLALRRSYYWCKKHQDNLAPLT